MKNNFIYSDSNKRYYTLDYYYKSTYHTKVFKVSLNIGCSCPNKDGTKGFGGCIYCKNSSGDFGGNIKETLKEQFNTIKNMMSNKWPNAKYIAYFQAGTNTYIETSKLKEYCEEVLTYENVVGINIATRCDSISDECLEYLNDLNKRTILTIELGLQSIHSETMKLLNLGYTLEEFEKAIHQLHKNNIRIVTHIINGLPYETKEMMIDTIKYINTLPIWGIKIHMLFVLKDTKLEQLLKEKGFHILSKEEYIDIICDQLEYLNKEIVINRITGDPNTMDLIEPTWLIKKFCVLNDIDKEMQKRDTYQGIKTN